MKLDIVIMYDQLWDYWTLDSLIVSGVEILIMGRITGAVPLFVPKNIGLKFYRRDVIDESDDHYF